MLPHLPFGTENHRSAETAMHFKTLYKVKEKEGKKIVIFITINLRNVHLLNTALLPYLHVTLKKILQYATVG
uniref:Uncharacterized protein n=1 Tax=Anguilla anguilla TaxID=7936 RepID=A0A0E9WJ53_ANGAN